MHLNVSQQMRMSQQMKLAPRMIQSMEILQLPLMALQERIDQELNENVVLEQVTNRKEEYSGPAEEVEIPKLDIERREMTTDDNNASDFERLLEISKEWPDDNYTSGSRPSSNRVEEDGDRQHDVMANCENRPETLHEHLLEQFHCDAPEHLRSFGDYLIHNLDPNGRLQSSLPELAQVFGANITLQDADQALKLVQRLDPPGVGARDLKECLLLQITPDTPLGEIMTVLISDHLDDILQNRLPLMERKTGFSLDAIKAAIEQMGTLNPYPGKKYDSPHVQSVTPDLKLEKNDAGLYKVELIDEYVPQLRINRRYIRMLEGNPDAATKEFIKRKIESAKWLIDSIEQRYNTLKRVAQSIVDEQTEFLDLGPEYIKPLKMQDIADVVGVHVTTVSRAVDDKYIATPRGIFPLKRFFGGGTKTADGEDVAWENIRLKLKEIVDKEDKSDPLSDDALVAELAKHGFNLARRTVTKYRKALNIPSSRQRREY
ncbi:RNA polymerase factor sigma-54 [Planctomicrobium piriforme]|uniref:RNA polymerase sigma-54 factor n=1 Tax=Planctomicrobium piriforme TaxID=1576369 RepID=A0A1I3CAM3_9PLAN|nr:RNA polymerase factor sigma-54 [Planctomicrobium piriforme]SFH71219.1 RNA polymerase sigma-54 factor [Planctomicrobium piriforme]